MGDTAGDKTKKAPACMKFTWSERDNRGEREPDECRLQRGIWHKDDTEAERNGTGAKEGKLSEETH